MLKKNISEILESVQSKIGKTQDKQIKENYSVLYNLVEYLHLDNIKLQEEKQKLKDEINQLKGEQGKPDIKANIKKDGDISSEQERKKAEASVDDSSREGFKLDKPSLNKLKDNRIPAEVLEQ